MQAGLATGGRGSATAAALPSAVFSNLYWSPVFKIESEVKFPSMHKGLNWREIKV